MALRQLGGSTSQPCQGQGTEHRVPWQSQGPERRFALGKGCSAGTMPCKPRDSTGAEISKPCGGRGELCHYAGGAGTRQHGAGCSLAAAPRPYQVKGPAPCTRCAQHPASTLPLQAPDPRVSQQKQGRPLPPAQHRGTLVLPTVPRPGSSSSAASRAAAIRANDRAGGCPGMPSAGAVGWQALPSPPVAAAPRGPRAATAPRPGAQLLPGAPCSSARQQQ